MNKDDLIVAILCGFLLGVIFGWGVMRVVVMENEQYQTEMKAR